MKTCKCCGLELPDVNGGRVFCSHACRAYYRGFKQPIACERCGASIKRQSASHKFCDSCREIIYPSYESRCACRGCGVVFTRTSKNHVFCEPQCRIQFIWPVGFYVYGLYWKHGEPLYVGKGSGRRAFTAGHRQFDERPYRQDPTFMVVIFQAWLDSNEALVLERKLIAELDPEFNRMGVRH